MLFSVVVGYEMMAGMGGREAILWTVESSQEGVLGVEGWKGCYCRAGATK